MLCQRVMDFSIVYRLDYYVIIKNVFQLEHGRCSLLIQNSDNIILFKIHIFLMFLPHNDNSIRDSLNISL